MADPSQFSDTVLRCWYKNDQQFEWILLKRKVVYIDYPDNWILQKLISNLDLSWAFKINKM